MHPDQHLRIGSPIFMLALVSLAPLTASGQTPWARHTIHAGGSSYNGADGARLGDVNGDGYIDVVTGFEQSDITRVMLNPGPVAAVKQPWQGFNLTNTPNVEDAFFADVDGDGRLDVVNALEGSSQDVKVNFAPSAGNITLASNWSQYAIDSADNVNKWMYGTATQLDGANGIDLIMAGKTDGGPQAQLAWFAAPANPRTSNGWTRNKIADVGWAMSVIDHDLDGDGDRDVILTDRTSSDNSRPGLRWFVNAGAANPTAQKSTWNEKRVGPERSLMFMDLVDVSGDGKLDMVTITSGGDVYWFEQQNIGQNTWTEHRVEWNDDGTGKVGKSVRVLDLNGDGKKEFIVAFEGTQDAPSILWLDSATDVYATNWMAHDLSGNAGDKFDLMQFLDLDADGDLDLITTEEGRTGGDMGLGVVWYENPYTPEPGSLAVLAAAAGLTLRRQRQGGQRGLSGRCGGDA